MTDTFEFTLDNPLTEEQWDMITDVDFDRTDRITFHTKHGKEVEFTKVIRCKDCIYWEEYCRIVDGVASDHVCSLKRELDGTMHRVKADDFCSWAERKEE